MASRAQGIATRNAVAGYAVGLLSDGALGELLADITHLTGEVVPVGRNFNYASFAAGATTTRPDTRSTQGEPEGVVLTYGGSITNGTLLDHTASSDWFSTVGVSDDDILLSIQDGARVIANQLGLERLHDVLAATDAAAAANSGTATIDLTNSGTEAVDLLQAEIEDVEIASGGFCDVAMLWGPLAFRKYANHAKVQARINGGANRKDPATVTLPQLDELLGMNTMSRRSRAVENSAAIGATASNAYKLSNKVYIVARSRVPSRIDPGAVKVFGGRQGNGQTLEPIFWQHPHGKSEKATWKWAELVQATNPTAIRVVTMTV